MSWWDPKSFSGLASQALKTAQKQIDKVLDIEEKDKNKATSSSKTASKESSPEDEPTKEESNSWNSWGTWMSPKSEVGEEKSETDSSLSAGLSSWTFSLGSQQPSTSTSQHSLSSVTKHDASKATKSSSVASKFGLSKRDKQENVPEEKGSSAVETEKDVKSKSKMAERLELDASQTVDSDCEVEENTASVAEDKTESDEASTAKPGEISSQGSEASVQKYMSDDAVCLLTFSSEKGEGISENVEDSREKVKDSSDKLEDSSEHVKDESKIAGDNCDKLEDRSESERDIVEEESVSESVSSPDIGETHKTSKSEGLATVVSEEVLVQETTYQDTSVKSNSVSDPTDCEQTDRTSSYSPEPGGNEMGDSTSEPQHRTDDACDAMTESSNSADPLETSTSQSDCDTVVRGTGLDCASRDSSFGHISESLTSVSSEPTLLSMSTEGVNVSLAHGEQLPDERLFSPPSHSSLASEEEREIQSAREGFSSLEDPSPVSSPPLDMTLTTSSNDSSETNRLDSSADTLVDRVPQLLDEVEGGKEEDEEWREETDLDAASSPSASFVKCMIEDAMGMEDPSKHEDSGSDNHSEEKSESSKVDSEFEKSVYSGHESSDDIETTTSSDIEIISTPTPNGEKTSVDLSPLQFSLQKAVRGQGSSHQRSDSQSSSSTGSKGEGEMFGERFACHDRGEWREEDDLDNPQHPQRLLKKLAEMAEVLQARETKLVQLSKDNNDLLETNSILRNQLQQLEEAKETEMADLNTLTEEFTRRMGEAERKMQTVLKEKEIVKQQLSKAEAELAKRSADINLESVLAEKDEQITGLMEEGEKLSKQQLQNSNIIKKLRAKEKESEGLITSQKKKLDQQKEELERLKTVLDAKEDIEKKQADAIKQLNTAVQMMEKENAKLKVEVESSEEKIRGLQTTLDNSYKEIAELHKSNASQDSRAQQAALSAEMQVREELKMAMEQESQRYRHEKQALLLQIEDLRLSMARMEKEQNRREEMLKQEISDLQMRLQEDESRTQDLTQSVTSATRPLLRQIENLQATHSIQASAWEKVEKNLTDRLSEAQTALALAQERERTGAEKLGEVTSRCTALDAANSVLRQEKAQLTAQTDSDRRRIDMLEERKATDVAQLELAKQKLSDEVAALRRDKVFLESQLETSHSRLESEKQRVAVAEEQIRILERDRPKSRGTPSPVSVSRQESVNSSFSERSSTPTWLPRHEEGESHMLGSGMKVSLYDSMRQSGAASLMENLQSQLKLREGEISQLQADIQQLERTRESMARELVSLTNLNQELQDQVEELPTIKTQHKELDSRYNALLQMYGEKEERVQELMLDLEDVKDMYKQQINSLMQ